MGRSFKPSETPQPNDFDLFVGLILAHLYEERGRRPNLHYEIFGIETPELRTDDVDRITIFDNTVEWLKNEGYLRYETWAPGTLDERCFYAVDLSERGFRVLNSLPGGLKDKADKRSFGSQLVEVASKGGWRAATKLTERGGEEASRRIIELVQGWMS